MNDLDRILEGNDEIEDILDGEMQTGGNPPDRAIASTADEAAQLIGVDFDKIVRDEFMAGVKVEMEHGTVSPETNVTDDDLVKTAKIALAHLNEIPDYYTRLAQMEAEGKKEKNG